MSKSYISSPLQAPSWRVVGLLYLYTARVNCYRLLYSLRISHTARQDQIKDQLAGQMPRAPICKGRYNITALYQRYGDS
jgi:hypothetical protein